MRHWNELHALQSYVMPHSFISSELKKLNRESPFAVDNLGGCGFVGDADLISLQAARLEGGNSSGGPFLQCWAPFQRTGCIHTGALYFTGAGCASGITAEDGSCLVDFPAWGRRAGPRQTIYFEPTEVACLGVA